MIMQKMFSNELKKDSNNLIFTTKHSKWFLEYLIAYRLQKGIILIKLRCLN